jgi:hypothetical protein
MAVELDSNNNGAIDIEKGGTNATTKEQARVSLGLEIGVDVAAQTDARFPTSPTTVAALTSSAGSSGVNSDSATSTFTANTRGVPLARRASRTS